MSPENGEAWERAGRRLFERQNAENDRTDRAGRELRPVLALQGTQHFTFHLVRAASQRAADQPEILAKHRIERNLRTGAAERRKELKQHEKNVRTGKKKPHQEEPQPAPAAKAKSAEKSESKRPRGAVKHGRTRAEREKAHRAAEKQRAARRFAHSRPVKKGKGSIKKDSKQRSQHTEVQ